MAPYLIAPLAKARSVKWLAPLAAMFAVEPPSSSNPTKRSRRKIGSVSEPFRRLLLPTARRWGWCSLRSRPFGEWRREHRSARIGRGGAETMGGVTDPASAAGGGLLNPDIAALLKRDQAGLITAVIQEASTGEVLMVGWMDDLALHKTLTTGRSTFFSRSRGEYWVKGETSGHRQWVSEVRLDCDGDTVLVKVHQEGAACHTGDRTCFDARRLPALVAEQAEEAGR